jgi:hypothetical protein
MNGGRSKKANALKEDKTTEGGYISNMEIGNDWSDERRTTNVELRNSVDL